MIRKAFPAFIPVREKVVFALKTRAEKKKNVISFSEVRRVLSWYHFRKPEREELLYELKEEGIIRIVPFHGIVFRDADGATA